MKVSNSVAFSIFPVMQSSPLSSSKNFITQKGDPIPIKQSVLLPYSPCPWQSSIYFLSLWIHFWMVPINRMIYMWPLVSSFFPWAYFQGSFML